MTMSSYALEPIPVFAHHNHRANLSARGLKTAAPLLSQPVFTLPQQVNLSVTAAALIATVATEPQVTAS